MPTRKSPTTTRPPKSIRLTLPPSPMSLAFRHLKPNWRAYLELVETAARDGDKLMSKFLAAYTALPLREQATVTPEQLCDLSSVKPSELFGAVCTQLWSKSHREASIISAMAMPDVVSRTAKEAAKPKGFRDREMFHKHTGFLPAPKGSQVNVNVPVAIGTTSAPRAALPSMAQEVIDLPSDEELLGLPAASGVESTQYEGDEEDEDDDD